ncbi:undecaprenyl-diphosphate phosphatase [Aquisalimonas asiatica]|uniref:Undecaprenyl-diphosphatase n=1 Tax=Aquisalimonas asiatica TaxID=406100 RepID=A0A1H8PQR8_9GAMM|nr:undecaprenyl-diphosphate phosphatase [Aquisalimonas asiatica]SEO44126.1 Undecaprenyl-diphosphatase [Aquisalimonas asiatica]
MALYIVVLLGIVQGAFMFLPVSSTAHLVLTQHWLIAQGADIPPPDSAEMILFDLVVHVGTLISIVIVFRRSLFRLIRDGLLGLARMRHQYRPLPLTIRLALLCALSVLATGVIGITFKLFFEAVFARPAMIAGTLTLTGVLLWITDRLPPRPRGLRDIRVGTALGIGAAQGLALVPGISRSGITIAASLLFGLKRRWAAEYSFFLAIPTILAATLVQAVELQAAGGTTQLGWMDMLVGLIVAAAVGTGALYLVVRLLYKAKLRIFSWYLWLLAILVGFGLIPLGY